MERSGGVAVAEEARAAAPEPAAVVERQATPADTEEPAAPRAVEAV